MKKHKPNDLYVASIRHGFAEYPKLFDLWLQLSDALWYKLYRDVGVEIKNWVEEYEET